MTRPLRIALKGMAVAAIAAIALTACTNASETGSTAASSGSAPASFDPTTVAKDASLAAEVPAAIRANGTLRIGSDTSFAPSEFLGGADNQTPMGYDVDLAKAIGAKLGLKVSYETASFPSILPAIGTKYDLGVSSFFIKKERLNAVAMVSYATGGSVWAVKTGNPTGFSPDDPCGRKVGVQTGSAQADDVAAANTKCTAAGKAAIEIQSFEKQTDINTRLANGTIDAMTSGSDVVGYAAQQTHGALEKVGAVYGTAPMGIAVAKDDPAFAQLVQKTLASLIADGSYQKVLNSWNVGDIAIAKPEVNPAVAS